MMQKILKIAKEQNAMTLIEVLVAISVFALISGLLMGVVVFNYQSFGYSAENAKAIDEARRGIDAMVKEIREAKIADNGAYPIEIADDKQIVFYSDIDNDGKTERVRYFLGTITANNQIKECTVSSGGGTCSVNFTDLLSGSLESGQVKISVDGDLDAANEYADISADGFSLGNLCQTGCLHCAGYWQGLNVFDIADQILDGSVTFLADASFRVGRECPASSPNHSLKARFELSWSEEVIGLGNELRKGITEPSGNPAEYITDQEVITVLTRFVRNDPPIFKYYDSEGDEIAQGVERLIDTKLVRTYLVINVNSNRPPNEYELESFVQLRNLKNE